MRVGVVGLGYVGAVTIACLAEIGHDVIGVDIDPHKVDAINCGRGPVVEPGLDEMLSRHVTGGQVSATTDVCGAAADVDLVILCVGTPSTASGGVDDRHLLSAAASIGDGIERNPRPFVVVASRSTSLPDVHSRVARQLQMSSGRQLGEGLGYACHPEFLRETTAIEDFFDPPVIIFGTDGQKTAELCSDLYPEFDVPFATLDVGEAALVKYAANCWHAVKVTFANEIGELCRSQAIDARTVMDLLCQDDKLNISAKYLRPGNPFGGSCLPKDLRAVIDTARSEAFEIPMLRGTLSSNEVQVQNIVDRVLERRPTKVAIIGLAFKEGTDDLREAPLIPIAERLIGRGVEVSILDGELVSELAGNDLSQTTMAPFGHLVPTLSDDLRITTKDADVIIVNHALAGTAGVWQDARVADTARILDLVGVEELESHPGYEGVYWSNDAEKMGSLIRLHHEDEDEQQAS